MPTHTEAEQAKNRKAVRRTGRGSIFAAQGKRMGRIKEQDINEAGGVIKRPKRKRGGLKTTMRGKPVPFNKRRKSLQITK